MLFLRNYRQEAVQISLTGEDAAHILLSAMKCASLVSDLFVVRRLCPDWETEITKTDVEHTPFGRVEVTHYVHRKAFRLSEFMPKTDKPEGGQS